MSQVDQTVSTPFTGGDLSEEGVPVTPPEAEPTSEPSEAPEPTPEAEPTSDPAEAPEPSTPDANDGETAEDKVRRGRGLLEVDVRSVTDAFAKGEITLAEGELLTPHRIGRQVKDRDSLDKAPSTGAIVNVLKKWGEIGFAVLNEKPLAFLDYTNEARNDGLSALKERHAAANPRPKRAPKAKAEAPAAPESTDGTGQPSSDDTGN